MWEESEKKQGFSCCLVVLIVIVVIIGLIVALVYSFFFAFFSAFSSSGNVYGGDGTYHFPLHGPIVVNSPFDPGRSLPEVYGDYEAHPHLGTDFQAAYGTVVIASREGVVSATYTTETGGVTMVIDHGDNEETRYLHLSGYIAGVGESIGQGQPIAYSGNSGSWTTGPHLHFEIRISGTAIDPMSVLTA